MKVTPAPELNKVAIATHAQLRVSKTGIALIQHFESCKLTAYQDSAGIWTIGWGNTFYENGKRVQKGDKITQERADSLFLTTLKKFEQTVLIKTTRQLLQHEFDALVSFCYNAGSSYRTAAGIWRDYDIWRKVNARDTGIQTYWQTLAITAGGKKRAGLVRRRKSEALLFSKGELKYFI